MPGHAGSPGTLSAARRVSGHEKTDLTAIRGAARTRRIPASACACETTRRGGRCSGSDTRAEGAAACVRQVPSCPGYRQLPRGGSGSVPQGAQRVGDDRNTEEGSSSGTDPGRDYGCRARETHLPARWSEVRGPGWPSAGRWRFGGDATSAESPRAPRVGDLRLAVREVPRRHTVSDQAAG